MTATARSYGTGSLWIRADARGVESWYGQWRSGGRRCKRRLGPVRTPGSKAGLTRTQAERALRGAQAETPTGSRPASERLTVEIAAARYLRHLEALGRERATVVAAESACRVWLVPTLGTKTLDRVTPEDVEDLMSVMARKPLAAKSIRNYIGCLSAIYSYAMHPRRKWATSNPCEAVDLPRVVTGGEIKFYDPEEVAALVRHARPGAHQDLDRLMYLVAERTGLRHGELIALRWRDLDYGAMRVCVCRAYVLGRFTTPKSATSFRSLPLDEEAAGAIERYRKANGDPDDAALIFGDPITGEPLSKSHDNRRFKATLRAAGLDERRVFHGLRHSFGVRCAAAGIPIRTLMAWMGHANIATTMRYAAYAPSAHENEMIARAFGGATRGADVSESQVI